MFTWQFLLFILVFFFSSRRRHTRLQGDWSSDVCSSDLMRPPDGATRPRIALRSEVFPEPFGPRIGRASCRERSVDLGGRRIIKKKKKRNRSPLGRARAPRPPPTRPWRHLRRSKRG